ncbi:amidohydrolase [Cohnella endophytica]|uniref:Amidohydrolase n=1 Tax=Cohnella endophytica TaxID=2419778 RepID=A0A494Y3M7_9BACL|nr:amidohydrolase family protein [Cohnella endophytica]RKP57347.1 amidohydrolase [Cohnella endophytica]
MRIDAHQHYWKLDRDDYGWITPELQVLYRDFMPADLEKHLRDNDISGTITVQAAPTIEETDYLLTLAEGADSILGVVGWLDLFDPGQRGHFQRFRQHPKFVGFRIMIQDMPDANRILEPAFVEALREYAEEDVPVDLLVKADQLGALNLLLEQVPGLRSVIDHIAKPKIAEGLFEPWAEQLKRAASHPNICCKLSGMVTEADHRTWKKEHFTRYVRHVLEAFGPRRVLFGTDWPVCLLAAGYDDVVDILEQALPDTWGKHERARLYGDNAKEFYKL